MDFHVNKYNFLVHLQLKICLNLHIPSRENASLFCIDGELVVTCQVWCLEFFYVQYIRLKLEIVL